MASIEDLVMEYLWDVLQQALALNGNQTFLLIFCFLVILGRNGGLIKKGGFRFKIYPPYKDRDYTIEEDDRSKASDD